MLNKVVIERFARVVVYAAVAAAATAGLTFVASTPDFVPVAFAPIATALLVAVDKWARGSAPDA